MKASTKSRVGNKPKEETSDSEVICTHSLGNARLSRRFRGSTTRGRNLGLLGSGKFEIHLEYDCSYCYIMYGNSILSDLLLWVM